MISLVTPFVLEGVRLGGEGGAPGRISPPPPGPTLIPITDRDRGLLICFCCPLFCSSLFIAIWY